MKGLSAVGYQDLAREQSWNNLPILTEWRRLFPDRDPVQMHEELWGERLICPAGGKYVWDERWQTMKSTAVGQPGEPVDGQDLKNPLPDFRKADFGINFEDGGLRGRLEVEK
ncbi:MAG: hypothetical protein ABS79_05920 [Planctomycetes bacterium SCN 63-9]|nr:MAG: hypothetical protein ABS79_05920 [Planctomycetes bacterium SCN 63-9]